MADSRMFDGFEATLKVAQSEGLEGRSELLEKLARMPMEKIVALPASSLAILGPQGLARLAARREELAGTDRKARMGGRPAAVSSPGKHVARRPRSSILSATLMVAAILGAGLLIDVTRPLLDPLLIDDGVRSRDTSRWPVCRRLDHHVDGCLYESGSGRLTLGEIAALTDIPIETVLAANTHLGAYPNTAIAKGSRIAIWRDRLRLEGNSQ